MNHVFIVTYGRSGSTLLQAVLNSIDGYKIVGENYHALLHLYRSCRSIRRSYNDWGKISPVRGWLGASDFSPYDYETEIAQLFTRQVMRPTEDTRVAGFKEIRWGDCSDEEFFDILRFIERRFHGTKFVFNSRDAEEVAKSSWWRNTAPAKVHAYVSRMDSLFGRACDENPASRYSVNFNRYLSDPSELAGMFAFLNEPFDHETIKRVLAIRV